MSRAPAPTRPREVVYADNVNAGTASASASYAGNANHTGSSDSETFTIDKAGSTTAVTFEPGPYVYRGTAFTASAAATGAGGLSTSAPPAFVEEGRE